MFPTSLMASFDGQFQVGSNPGSKHCSKVLFLTEVQKPLVKLAAVSDWMAARGTNEFSLRFFNIPRATIAGISEHLPARPPVVASCPLSSGR